MTVAWLGSVATLFLLTSAGIIAKQRTARSCPLHSRAAGWLAEILAIACLVVGVGIGALALWLGT